MLDVNNGKQCQWFLSEYYCELLVFIDSQNYGSSSFLESIVNENIFLNYEEEGEVILKFYEWINQNLDNMGSVSRNVFSYLIDDSLIGVFDNRVKFLFECLYFYFFLSFFFYKCIVFIYIIVFYQMLIKYILINGYF